jgi:uncharacterized protein (DUF952 family)
MIIYKLMTVEEYESFKTTGTFTGNELDKRDGFIHMSQNLDQVARVRGKFYPQYTSLYKVSISLERLQNVRFEKSKSSDDIYPHEYGALNYDCVVEAEIIS